MNRPRNINRLRVRAESALPRWVPASFFRLVGLTITSSEASYTNHQWIEHFTTADGQQWRIRSIGGTPCLEVLK